VHVVSFCSSFSLDAMIGGGFLTGKIYEVCGPSGSGKTQLCLTISTHIAHGFKQEVHYIDTKTDFSGKRIQEVLDSKEYPDEVRYKHFECIPSFGNVKLFTFLVIHITVCSVYGCVYREDNYY
jgi:RecA/RadA recombinase